MWDQLRVGVIRNLIPVHCAFLQSFRPSNDVSGWRVPLVELGHHLSIISSLFMFAASVLVADLWELSSSRSLYSAFTSARTPSFGLFFGSEGVSFSQRSM